MLAGGDSLNTLFASAGISLPTTPFRYQSEARQLCVPLNAGPIGLAFALLRTVGFSWLERYRLIVTLLRLKANGWRVPKGQTVAQWLQQTRQPASLIDTFWAPLTLAILNTPLAEADMHRLAPTLRDTLGKDGRALGILQPPGNLTECIVSPLAKAIEDSGGVIRCGTRVAALREVGVGFELLVGNEADAQRFDQVVLALPPWSLSKMALPDTLPTSALVKSFGDQPIATVYLGFETDFHLTAPLLQIAGPTPADARVWAIDRAHCGEPGVIAVSLSAQGPWCKLSGDNLAQACLLALQNAVDGVPACLWKKAVIVQRATYASTPEAFIPHQDLEPLPHLHLAGDCTHPEYPATLEAAVYSGFNTAHRIMLQQT
jgi:protoporphyrinogen oxidase